MRKLTVTLILTVLLSIAGSQSFAEDLPYTTKNMALGESTMSISLDQNQFTDDVVSDFDLDEGVGLSTDVYYLIAPRLYVGASLGYGETQGSYSLQDIVTPTTIHKIDSEMIYIPIEFNGKMAFSLNSETVLTVGAGISFNYNKEKLSTKISGVYTEYYRAHAWTKGTQFFAELMYKPKYDNYFLGVRGKLKDMNNFNNYDRSYSNNSLSIFAGYYY